MHTRRLFERATILAAAGALFAVWMTGQEAQAVIRGGGEPTILTGCLGPFGILTNLAVGPEPRRPCRRHQTQVTIGEQGPPGVGADQECPPGEFVTGFDPDGFIRCAPLPGTKAVFVTSITWESDALGGLAGADEKCNALATDPDSIAPPGNYVAWLSTTDVDAIDRLTTDGTWVNLKGQVVALSKADLTDGSLLAGIAYDEFGNDLSNEDVWTGTGPDGQFAGDTDCDEWGGQPDGGRGKATPGVAGATDRKWTDDFSNYAPSCSNVNSKLRLYCFQN